MNIFCNVECVGAFFEKNGENFTKNECVSDSFILSKWVGLAGFCRCDGVSGQAVRDGV